jgi:prefoldin subunit 5
VAVHVTAADPGRLLLLDKIDAREQALAREAGQAQAQIGELTARLRELNEAISDLQVTRKTLISLAGQDDGLTKWCLINGGFGYSRRRVIRRSWRTKS